MRASLLGILVFVSYCAAGSPAHADDKAVRAALTANYAKISQAFRKNNLDAVTAFLAPDYTSTQSNGHKLKRAEVVAAIGKQRAMLLSADNENTVETLIVKGTTAIAVVHARMSGIISDAQGHHHKLLVIALSRDTWVKAAGAWKIQSDVASKETILLDGKPVSPAGSRK